LACTSRKGIFGVAMGAYGHGVRRLLGRLGGAAHKYSDF